ncbi:MAG: hypothetical protein LUG21_07180 [Clostridiales bacterium]|nr:hypothetical protein [Clostridiales bacterium]
MKQRLKSPVVWLSIIAQVFIVISAFYPSISEGVKVIGACVIEILTLMGIINNPLDCKKF